ncbi:MAG TPA: hypothetical protein VMQ76_05570 [Terracidiphilus sp.]|nr:hypothetical protein [Terracidiphilus sp.]
MNRILRLVLLGLFCLCCSGASWRVWQTPAAGGGGATLSSAVISTNGDTLTLTFSGNVTTTTGFTCATSGADPFTVLTPTYASGSGTTALVFNLQRNCLSSASETVTVSGPGAGDYTAFTTHAVTNSSTVAAMDSITGTTNANTGLGANSGNNWQGMLFTAANTRTVRMMVVRMARIGSPVFNFNGYIYTQSSGHPGTLVGTGSATYAAGSLGLSEQNALFTGMSASITASTGYAVVFNAIAASENFTDYIAWYQVSGASNSWGNSSDGTTWTMQNDFQKCKFILYGN